MREEPARASQTMKKNELLASGEVMGSCDGTCPSTSADGPSSQDGDFQNLILEPRLLEGKEVKEKESQKKGLIIKSCAGKSPRAGDGKVGSGVKCQTNGLSVNEACDGVNRLPETGMSNAVGYSGMNSLKRDGVWANLFNSLIDSIPSNGVESVTEPSSKDRKTVKFNVEFKNNELEVPLNISRIGRAYRHNALMDFFVHKFTSFHYIKN